MLSKAKIQFLRSLQQKKFRQRYQNFMVEGDKIVDEVLRDKNTVIEGIFGLSTWFDQNKILLKRLNPALVQEVSAKDLEMVSSLNTPNQVLAVLKMPPPQYVAAVVQNSFSLYLDNLQDPGNIGTIVRTADWFGVQHVFLSPNCADIFNPKVIQSTMGAFLRVKTLEMTWTDLCQTFHEVPKIGAVLRGENLFTAHLPKRGIIVIGNESKGISSIIENQLDIKIQIKGEGGAESLNAAVAAGIVCAVMLNK